MARLGGVSIDVEIFRGKENEGNWLARDTALVAMLEYIQKNGSVSEREVDLLSLIRPVFFDLLEVMHTPRTQLALNCLRFLQSFVAFLGTIEFEPFCEATIKNLMKLCGTTKKIVANAAQETLTVAFRLASIGRVLTFCQMAAFDKNQILRVNVIRSLLRLLSDPGTTTFNFADLEITLTKILSDANADVRQSAVEILLLLEEPFKVDLAKMFASMDPASARQLKQSLAKKAQEKLKDADPEAHAKPGIAIVDSGENSLKVEVKQEAQKNELLTSDDEEVIIPMKKVTISEVNDQNSSFEKTPTTARFTDVFGNATPLSAESTLSRNMSSSSPCLSRAVQEPSASIESEGFPPLSSSPSTEPSQPRSLSFTSHTPYRLSKICKHIYFINIYLFR